MNTKKLLLAAVCVVFLATSAAFALPSPISVTGTNSDGEPLSATADFAFTDTSLTLTLTNNVSAADFRSAGQLLSDFSFTLSGGTLTSLTSISGNAIDIALDGTTSPGTPVSSTDWQLSSNNGTFLLTALFHAQPDYMIIGGVSGDTYSLANASITHGMFDPFLQTSATFTLSGAGLTGATITGATFSFGTGPETFISTPDSGSTLMLLGLAMIGLAAICAKFQKA